MPGPITCQAIVLRSIDYRDYDRILTLFSPDHGLITAAARACRRPKSPLLNASTPFALGEFVLKELKGKYTVASCQLEESYFPLRQDPLKLAYGSFLLSLCEEAVQPAQTARTLFVLLLKALAYLSFGEESPEGVSAAFVLHMLRTMGLGPELDRCVHCGVATEPLWRFDAMAGGVACSRCRGDSPLPYGLLPVLRQNIAGEFAPLSRQQQNAWNLLSDYACTRFEHSFRALEFLRQMQLFEM